MRHSPRFALKALLKFSLGALNQNIHTVLSSSSDNNRPITEICQKLGGAKNVFPKNWLFDIAKIHYHPTILSSLTNLIKWVQVRYHLLLQKKSTAIYVVNYVLYIYNILIAKCCTSFVSAMMPEKSHRWDLSLDIKAVLCRLSLLVLWEDQLSIHFQVSICYSALGERSSI